MKKKSGAAQRLVSLVLALGLIFTLAPASVFAGDEVPASSAVMAAVDEEPVADGTEPVADGTEPAVDGTEPVVDDSEPVADSTEPAEEPAVEQDALKSAPVAAPAPAALGDAPETRGAFDETFVISELASSATLYGALERNYGLGGYDWYDEQTVGGSISFDYTVRGNNLYYFVAVPDGEVPYVYYTNEDGKYVPGTMEALASAKDIPDSFRQKAQDANCDYVFRFTGRAFNDQGDTTKIKVGTIKNSCTVSVNDSVLTASDFEPTLPQSVAKGGNISVTLNESMTEPMITLAVNGTPLNLPLNLEEDLPFTTELPDGTKVAVTYKGLVGGYKYELAFTNIQSDLVISDYKTRQVTDMATVPTELTGVTVYYKDYDDPDYTQAVLDQPIPLDFDFAWGGQVRATQFKIVVDENYEAPVSLTLTKKNGEVINKTLDYDPVEKCYTFTLTRGIWNSDADIEIAAGDDSYVVNMAVSATPKTVFDAKFYIHEEGKTEAYTFVGTGSVAFGAPVREYVNNPIELDSTNLDKVTEPSKLTFPDIFVDGVKYVYSKGSTKAGTYDFKGWDVAKAAWTDDTETKLEWHVDGIIEVNSLPELSDDMKPEVVGTTVTYDGYAHGLTINYKKNYPKRYFKVTYEVWNEDTEAWDELPLGQVPAQTEAGRMDVRVTFEYRFPEYPHLPLTVETSIVVMPRPLDLTVQDVTILKGETPTFTVIPSAEGENTGLLTSLGHTLVDWKVNENYNKDVAGEYSITLDLSSLKIVDKAGNDVTKNYSFNLVPGTLTVKALLPADLQPTVGNTSSTYDGQAHGLYISYPDGTSASDYKVEYQIADGAWSETAPSLTNVDKVENVKVRFTYDDYATYEAPGEYSVEVTKRALTLRVNDDKIEDGERIPAFSYTITSGSLVSGQSITGVTYGGYKDELGIYDVNILTYKIVAGATDVTGNYEVTLLPGVFTIGTAGGGGGTTPTPNPNPNPTPVPVPVEPETPVTPVAPVTPDEEEEEPAEVEDIEEEETPQASPDTDADKEEDKTENIEDEETAQAGAPGEGNWALLNLILMVLTVVAGLAMLALRFARKTGMAHLLGIVPAIVALVAFFVTEDMSLPMAMTDKWTLIMALIAVVQVVLLVLGRNGAQEDDQPREQY